MIDSWRDPEAADVEVVLAVGRAFFVAALDPMMLTRPDDGTILDANPRACQVLGYSLDEIRALGRDGLRDPHDGQWATGLRQRAETGSFAGELWFRRADGTTFPAEVSSSVFTVHGTRYAVLIFRDVSERHRLASYIHGVLGKASTVGAALRRNHSPSAN